MALPVLAVGGPPGSGKSTAGRAVADARKLTYHAAGDLFRAEAARRGMDLETFSHYAEAHPEVDRTIDEEMATLARPGVVLDGRIQGTLLRRRQVPVIAILITADEEVRARRAANRDHQTLDEARRRVRERAQSERDRYRQLYDIDLDAETGDLAIDSSHLAPDQVRDQILAFLAVRQGA